MKSLTFDIEVPYRVRVILQCKRGLWAGAAVAAVLGAQWAGTSNVVATGGDTGFIFHEGQSKDLRRFNIATGVDELIDTTDASCTGVWGAREITDLEVDTSTGHLYWVNDRSDLGRIDLDTGECELLSQNLGNNSNGRKATWRGLAVDSLHHGLFFVDNLGDPRLGYPVNITLNFVDVTTTPVTVTNVPLLPSDAATQTVVNFANDLVIRGDYVYIAGKNSTCTDCTGPVESEGGAIYRVRVWDGSGNLITNPTSTKVFSWVGVNAVQMITMQFHGSSLYLSHAMWQIGGIHRIDATNLQTISSPITSHVTVVQNVSTYDIDYGFTFGSSSIVYTSDRPVYPGPFKLIAVDTTSDNVDCGGQPQYSGVEWNTATCTILDAYTNANAAYYGQLDYVTGFSLVYDANGGTGGTEPATCYGYFSSCTVEGNTGTLTRDGYLFAGWNTDASGEGDTYADGADFRLTDDAQLFAMWTPTTPPRVPYTFPGFAPVTSATLPNTR